MKRTARKSNAERKASSSTSSLRRYFAEAERYFSLKFGAPLLLSPRDVAKVGEWHAQGIPLKAVKSGIDRHFERLDPAKKRKAVVLSFCENDILDAWENLRGRGVERGGSASRERKKRVSPAKILERYRRRLKKARKDAAEAWTREVVEALLAVADKLRRTGKIPVAEKMRARLERVARDAVLRCAPESTREAASRFAAKELAPYRPRMEESAYEAALAERTLLRLRSEAGIPEFPE